MAQKHQILLFATSYLPLTGGAELALKNITDRLPDFSFDLITGRYDLTIPARERIGNVNVFRIGGRLAGFNFLLPKLFFPIAGFLKGREFLKEKKYDLIWVIQASQAAGALWLLKVFGYVKQPVILNIQEGKNLHTQPWLTRLARRLILQSVDYFTVISMYLKRALLVRGIAENRIALIPNGVDMERFGSLSVHPRQHSIITVSRLVGKNAVADIIEAVAVLKRKQKIHASLTVIGDGELKPVLLKQGRNLGLEGQIQWLGTMSHNELPKYLAEAAVFVRPSETEGLGTAFLEAMAAGVPIIGTPVGGIPDFLKDRETGLICRVHDPEDLARSIGELFSDSALRARLVANARALIQERYTWDTIARQYRKLCNYILKS
ncbi:MAG TPA: glycosyltransferase family 4 protein [Candidatus Paceibacterota bacterium]|nr:glycosyltransferase family 4 protein [Candidatus Paceibacterota bacterium]